MLSIRKSLIINTYTNIIAIREVGKLAKTLYLNETMRNETVPFTKMYTLKEEKKFSVSK